MMNLIEIAESGLIPDAFIRLGIRRLLSQRLKRTDAASPEVIESFVQSLRQSPLAVETDAANEQHYEVPVEFFKCVLGPSLKYSSCIFPDQSSSLRDAEQTMLRLTAERAEVEDGMKILELGCGWGSLSLWLAEHFPNSQITAVSNSSGQREYIDAEAADRRLSNLQILTADMRDFDIEEKFDRVVSVEMFEHMRNYELLFRRVSKWLHPSGKAFVHVFCHRDSPYLFETEGAANWMGRHFFTGGTMPSEDLFSHFNEHLQIETQWRVSGLHYWKTCEVWLRNLDNNRRAILDSFREGLSNRDAKLNLQRWRMFFMACAELFRYRGGNEWFVAHYLFRNVSTECAFDDSAELQQSVPATL